MSDMVLVALDRDDLDAFLGGDRSYQTQMAVMNDLAAALAADPAVLEEQIARAIYSTVGYYSWDDYGDKESYRESARAVLASVGEGERDEG